MPSTSPWSHLWTSLGSCQVCLTLPVQHGAWWSWCEQPIPAPRWELHLSATEAALGGCPRVPWLTDTVQLGVQGAPHHSKVWPTPCHALEAPRSLRTDYYLLQPLWGDRVFSLSLIWLYMAPSVSLMLQDISQWKMPVFRGSSVRRGLWWACFQHRLSEQVILKWPITKQVERRL